jgi:hypothetical protein
MNQDTLEIETFNATTYTIKYPAVIYTTDELIDILETNKRVN